MTARWIWIPMIVLAMAGSLFAKTYTLGSTGFEMSGDISIVFRELDKDTQLNTNSRGDDPYNNVRARLFFQKAWTETIDLYLEFLWDVGAPARIQGAYLTFYDLWTESLALKVGMIPSPFGNYGHRSTYFNQNALIGVPAMWLTETPLKTNGSTHNEDLFPYGPAGLGGVYAGGYDSCWDYGMNLMFQRGIVEAQLAWTLAVLSSPYAMTNDGYQGILNLGLHPITGLRFGGSVAYGPWITGSAEIHEYDPTGNYAASSVAGLTPTRSTSATYGDAVDPEEFMQTAIGGYAEYSFGLFQFFGEFMTMTWETPYIYEEELTANSAYLEGIWKFVPGWEFASRFDRTWYSEIAPLNDGTGEELPWAPDFSRFEAAVGYRIIREGFIRLDYQHTMFDSDQMEDVDLLALQFLFAF
ncbi:hypothetical protein KQI52_07095 [bacterium]|nr:hypothetical protein [bacterium]